MVKKGAAAEEISKLRDTIIQMEVDFNRERGERLISEIILCCLLFAAGVILGFWMR